MEAVLHGLRAVKNSIWTTSSMATDVLLNIKYVNLAMLNMLKMMF